MYGHQDNYDSPHSLKPTASMASVFGAIDDEFDEFGILGIAIGKKARTKKHEKKLAKILGKLKGLLDQNKLDKAQKHAKKLAKSVRVLEKVSEDYEPSSEVEAWLAFADDGDSTSLLKSLGKVSLTGQEYDNIPGGDYRNYQASTRFKDKPRGGGRGRGRSAPRRTVSASQRLPPGFRPRGYTRWRRGRKIAWLTKHPSAASARNIGDPRSWARPGIRPVAARPRRRGLPLSMRRPGQAAARNRRNRRARGGRFSGLIGIDAFTNVPNPDGYTRESLLLGIGDEAADDVDLFGLDFGEPDNSSFGGKGAVRYGPLKKKLDAKLKVAKRKYNRAISVGDSDSANQWLAEYQRIATKQAEMRANPQLETFTQARMVAEIPLFSTSTAGKEMSDSDVDELIQFADI